MLVTCYVYILIKLHTTHTMLISTSYIDGYIEYLNERFKCMQVWRSG